MSDDETVYRYSDDESYGIVEMSDGDDASVSLEGGNEVDDISDYTESSCSPSESKRLKNTIDGYLNQLENAFSEAEAMLVDFQVPSTPMIIDGNSTTASPVGRALTLVENHSQIDATVGAFEEIIEREMQQLCGKVGPFHTKAMNEILRLIISRGEVNEAKAKYFDFLQSLSSPNCSSSDRNGNYGGLYTYPSKLPSLKESQEMQDKIEDMLDHFCNAIRSKLNSVAGSSNQNDDHVNISTTGDRGRHQSQSSHFDPHQLLKEIFENTRALFHPFHGARPSEKLWFKVNLKYGRMICETRDMKDFLLEDHGVHEHRNDNCDHDIAMETSESTTSLPEVTPVYRQIRVGSHDNGDHDIAMEPSTSMSNDTPIYSQIREVITDLISSTSRHTCSDLNDVEATMKVMRSFNIIPDALEGLRDGLCEDEEALSVRTSSNPIQGSRSQYNNGQTQTYPPKSTRSYIQLHRAQVYAMDMYISVARQEHHDLLRNKYALVQREVDRGCILDPKSRAFMQRIKPTLFAGHDVLSEDLWIRIMQYCCTSSLNEMLKNNLSKMAMVSKDFFRQSNLCLKTVPMNLQGVSYKNLAWACQEQIKIKMLDCTSLLPSGFLYVLHCCSIQNLSSLSVQVTMPNYGMPSEEQIWQNVALLNQEAREVCIPNDLFEHKGNLMEDLKSLHRHIELKIREKILGTTICLKELTISICKEGWHEPLLGMFSHTIEVLSLTIHTNAENRQQGMMFDFDDDLQNISRMIEGMTKLKKIQITAEFSAHFHIRSQSLTHICTQFSNLDFRVEECICPLLEVFKCVHRIRPDSTMYNGVAPDIPFRLRDIRILHRVHRLEMMEIEEGDVIIPHHHRRHHIPHPILLARLPPHIRGEFLGRTHATFTVSSRAFRGMEVPETCVVHVAESSESMERLLAEQDE